MVCYSPFLASGGSLLRVDTGGSLLRVGADASGALGNADGLDGVLQVHDAALGAGNRAANNDHVELRIDLDHDEVLNSGLLIAHLAGADVALEDAGGAGGGAHGAGVTMHGTAAVGGGGTLCAAALDGALVAVALGGAGDVDVIALGEDVSLDLVADVHLGGLFQLELLQVLLEGDARLGEVASLGLAQLGFLDVLKAQLHGGVAVFFVGLLLSDDAGSRLDHGDGDHVAGLIEDLGHAHFLADDSFLHVFLLLFVGYWLTYADIGSRWSANLTCPSLRRTADAAIHFFGTGRYGAPIAIL